MILLGIPVQIPGFCGTKSAQIPARYDNAAVISSSDPPHADTQDCTLAMKLALGQKHLESLLDLHLGTRLSQVFKQLGRTGGQGAEDPGGGGLTLTGDELVELVVVDELDWPGVVVVVGVVMTPWLVVVVVPGRVQNVVLADVVLEVLPRVLIVVVLVVPLDDCPTMVVVLVVLTPVVVGVVLELKPTVVVLVVV